MVFFGNFKARNLKDFNASLKLADGTLEYLVFKADASVEWVIRERNHVFKQYYNVLKTLTASFSVGGVGDDSFLAQNVFHSPGDLFLAFTVGDFFNWEADWGTYRTELFWSGHGLFVDQIEIVEEEAVKGEAKPPFGDVFGHLCRLVPKIDQKQGYYVERVVVSRVVHQQHRLAEVVGLSDHVDNSPVVRTLSVIARDAVVLDSRGFRELEDLWMVG